MAEKEKCKAEVLVRGLNWPTFRRCSRNVWKDGYCKIHHPASVAERQKKSELAYEQKRSKEPWYLLIEAKEKIKELSGILYIFLKNIPLSHDATSTTNGLSPDIIKKARELLSKYD